MFLLGRLYDSLKKDHPSLFVKKRQVVPPPILQNLGKKTMLVNFASIVSVLNRTTEHVQSYINCEMATESSVDGNSRLVIKGKFNSRNLEKVLKKYISDYVMCDMCKSYETIIVKDSITRLSFINCDTCKSSKSVNPIGKK